MSRIMPTSRSGTGVPFGGAANGLRGTTFQSGGRIISANTGFLANPSHAANNAGALTRNEASAIGLQLAGRSSGPFSSSTQALPGFRN